MGLALIQLAGCAPGTVAIADSGAPAVDVTAAIGPAGGELVHGSGASVAIPPGALGEPVTVLLGEEDGLWRLEPVDLVLDLPATLCLPGDAATERLRWMTPEGLRPLVTTWGADGRGCAPIGRFGAGDVVEVVPYAGRPVLQEREVAWVAGDDGWHLVAVTYVWHPHGATRVDTVTTWLPDGADAGMLDQADPAGDGCTQPDAWTWRCSQDVRVEEPLPRWAWLGASDEDGDPADFAIWEIAPP